jgi:hypothetical protein
MRHILQILILIALTGSANADDIMVDRHEHERGPDTAYARDGFQSRFGFAFPATVTNLYYYNPPGWLDGIWRIQFKCSDTNVLAKIVAHLELEPTTEPEIGMISSSQAPIPVSWKQPVVGNSILIWQKQAEQFKTWVRKKKDYFWYLWWDEKTSTVWYEEFST